MSTLSRNIADAVIAVLERRKGFDGWWSGIDDETSDDIMEELSGEIEDWLEIL